MAKDLLSKLPRPPGPSAKDIGALASGQNRQVILDRIKARQKGSNARRKAGGRP